MSSELSSDPSISGFQMDNVAFSLSIDAVQLIVLAVELRSHISGNTFQVSQDVGHSPTHREQ